MDQGFVSTDILTDASTLRFTNFIGGVLLAFAVRSLLLCNIQVYNGKCEGQHESNVRCKRCPIWSVGELIHTTINVYLFPPLFFFYGLYYTDVLSALSVLYAYRCYLAKQHNRVVFAGLLSLLFRQTNIFWVSVFFGGLELCRTIPKGRPEIEYPSQPTLYVVIKGSWQHTSAYDPLISQACFEDYIKTCISYAIAGLSNLSTVMWPLSPYLVIISAFAEFVYWNGGVVLGTRNFLPPSLGVLTCFRRQGEPCCLNPPDADDLHLAVFYLLLMASSLSSIPPRNCTALLLSCRLPAKDNGLYFNGSHVGGSPLQHHRPPFHACR